MNSTHVLSYSGQVTLTGLVIVFFALVTLILCIWLMSKILGLFTGRKKEKLNVVEEAPAPAPAPAPVEIAEETEEAIDPGVIVAIAAAVSAFTDSGKQLVIRSVRRSNNWARAARGEQIGRF